MRLRAADVNRFLMGRFAQARHSGIAIARQLVLLLGVDTA
jgi:hypothetical protein